ncbi:hypothetical protein [Paenibacillus gansuensis]|uniref:Uncharacterized protein n=1 Tax=Paenibacillus gansuensis TaxID=306542 RepID=A0ABW5PDX3_9BACL
MNRKFVLGFAGGAMSVVLFVIISRFAEDPGKTLQTLTGSLFITLGIFMLAKTLKVARKVRVQYRVRGYAVTALCFLLGIAVIAGA